MPSPVKKPKISNNESKNEKINEDYCINVIRMLSADQPTAAKSGHPGAPIACAPMVHVLYRNIMKYNPRNPKWSNRDRFVLSNGHACALQYSILHLSGYDLTLDDLKSFRQYGSKCPGHPENQITPGVEVTTGPLGQGIANAVGLAIAEKHLAAEFNRAKYNVVDHYTFCICGDGCLQEGVSSEACSLAGHLGLGKLILLYDDNRITIDGPTSLSFSEDVLKRYEAYGWHTQSVEDGTNDYKAIESAIQNAKKVTDRPSIIKIHTIIGMNSSVQNTEKAHGSPLTEEDLSATKKKYGLKDEKFYVPQEVYNFYDRKEAGKKYENEWVALFREYEKAYPELANDFKRREKGELPVGWETKLPKFSPSDKAAATRKFSEAVLNAAAGVLPELMGGSADLTPSNLTRLTSSGDFQSKTAIGRYLRFGVREHGMSAICNGIFAHGLLRPFCATFLNFIGYALGAVRLSAVSEFGVIYIATHDSIFLGEDGPTHQPIEMLASLRALPNLYVYRPADGNEVTGSYICAIDYCKNKPSVLALSRSNVPNLIGSSAAGVRKGAYTLCSVQNGKLIDDHTKPSIILVATGTEVNLAVKAAELYKGGKVRVVSMPCREIFEEQPLDYKKSVLGQGVPVMSIEAAATSGWHKYSHMQYGIDSFGQSASIEQLEKVFHLVPSDVVEGMYHLIKFYDNGKKPCDLFDLPSRRLPLPNPHKKGGVV